MKQFFKFMFASMIGTFITIMIASILCMFIFFAMLGGVISEATEGKTNKIAKVEKNSILQLKLNKPITDRTSENPFENFDLNTMESKNGVGLDKMLRAIEKAKTDDKIKGIYLDLSFIPAGMATLEELRAALIDFKTSKKWIVSYSEVYTQGSYYIASAADKIYVNPAGIVEHRGLATELMFFKNALEKLDVEMQIIRHGKFKSAVEPFMLEKMSDANREQMQLLLNTAWNSMTKKVAKSRGISVDKLNELADNMTIQNAKIAKKEGLVDELYYKDELLAELRKRLDIENDDEINAISLAKYAKTIKKKKGKKAHNQIAVVYAAGEINSGKSQNGSMGSETISKAIREARLDSNIKAIVLRVNSPGGSALASDVMWREVVLAKKAKPVIVSMGNVAASGGYYIACAADKIVADEKTITGSIGVFGVIPNAKGLMNNKLGITFDRAQTNKHAGLMSVFKPLTGEEKDIIQIGVEKIYDDFITKVAEGRGMTKEEVDAIGQGRVWMGKDALNIGLVDEIGGMDRAIEIAKEHAKLDDYEMVSYPKLKDPFEELMEELSLNIEARILNNALGNEQKYYKKLQNVTQQSGVMARMAFDIDIH
ncbi:MAG: signal peptide peptidase SppA [Vicingaceae bacterium]